MLHTAYAKDNDMTFILEEIETNKKKYVSVVGFYYGKPDEELTQKYAYAGLQATVLKD